MQDDQLLGYLLGALDPQEMLEVERQLQSDPRLRARLQQLEAMLEPLEQLNETYEPPADLVARTMNAIEDSSNHRASNRLTGSSLSPVLAIPNASTRSWWDVGFSVAAFLAMFALCLPALYQTREQARTVACADQLRDLGTYLVQYATRASDSRFPGLDQSGREAFAGVYAVRLKGAGLLEEDHLVWCPSGPEVGEVPVVPQPESLASADDARLASFQRLAGGRYAYNLGVVENERFVAPKIQQRTQFAMMSDLLDINEPAPHPGVFNLLYEDGRVARRTMHTLGRSEDHPLLNHAGRHEAGVDENDAVLGRSSMPPFVWVEQR